MTDTARTSRTETGDDVIEVLLDQHQRIRLGMSAVLMAKGPERREQFDEVRALLAVHEAAEEMVLRPVSRAVAGDDIADARNDEEHAAAEALATLEDMDVDDPGFDPAFARFQEDVLRHARNEESLEFPRIRESKDLSERVELGRMLKQVEKTAPTHPHPSTAGSTLANWTVGPFASMVDHVKDAIGSLGRHHDEH
jgi:hemerythrin superfamily protein